MSNESSTLRILSSDEFNVIVQFFHVLKECYEVDKIPRHVVFSIRDNVQDVVLLEVLQQTGTLLINPLDDGSIVPHYSAKGKGGTYAVQYLQDEPNLQLTLITIPFLYTNFLGFFAPLPTDVDGRQNQWSLMACFGDGGYKIDMMSPQDLSYIVPNIFANPNSYDGKNLRLVGEQISMDDIALLFSDIFGKDVIYNPLTPEELSLLPVPAAPAMAQMCVFVANPPETLRHDLSITKELCHPRTPQLFKDWLLIHSNADIFQQIGLDVDAPEITRVTVFGATSLEGKSVVKGLLADKRKKYFIRVTSRHVDAPKTKALKELDPDRIEIIYADYDDVLSCQKAVDTMDGVFLVTDFYYGGSNNGPLDIEEQHAKNIIDACELSASVKHLVFSVKQYTDDVVPTTVSTKMETDNNDTLFDAKARAAAYARTKNLSVTYILMPCYSELFFDMIERKDNTTVMTIPSSFDDTKKVMCMSVDDLGPAVANIFDSYQVYAGHEVGLVTDFVAINEIRDMIDEVFFKQADHQASDITDDNDRNNKDTMNNTAEVDEAMELDQGASSNIDNNTSTMNREQLNNNYGIKIKDTYMKDLGQMFVAISHSSAVQKRHSLAKTMKLVPSAKPLKQWILQNSNNIEFREKLGLR